MKVPAVPPKVLAYSPRKHLRVYEGPLWRTFRTLGPYALDWDELRHHGPIPNMRFDPHPMPEDDYPDVGVMYTSTTPHTALGEVYQNSRVIDRSAGGVTIASWIPTRPLQLLDLTSNWPVMNGAAASMMMDDKATTQAWARAVFDQFGLDLDGLYHVSSINNEPMITLFSRSKTEPSFPARVSFRALLSDATADEIIRVAKVKLGYKSI